MKMVLLPLAVAALIALPALSQPGPGIAPGPQATPAATQRQPGPGFGFEGNAAPAPAAAKPASAKPASETNAAAEPAVYDEAADAKADVAAAVAKAKKENKRVLVTLGANWCSWCRSLDKTFTTDEKVAAELGKAYVPVKVDVGRMKPDSDRLKQNLDLAASWGADPKKGIPLLVVLDGNGKAVKVQDTGVLEAGKGHDPEKVVAFLKENAKR
ncbi:MAG: thioredoxin family protein [Thermoanaerobaculia bacterium]